MKKRINITIALSILLVVLFSATNPGSLPAPLLVAPFLLLFLLFFVAARIFFSIFELPRSKAVRISLLCAATPTLLLAMQSVGQLTIRDIATLLVFFGITYFYMSRMSIIKRQAR